MNYTKLISKKKQYKYSVNICFDLHDEDRLKDFIPNVTTTEIIREYLGGIIRGNSETHSRILYGSYGTGKSHLLTVISAVLGHINTGGKGFKQFANLISKYDVELADDIRKFVMEDKPYLIVPIYSDYEDFNKCIAFSIKKELNKHGITVCFKGFYDEALSLVEKWLSGEESASRLEEECEKNNITVTSLCKGLSTYNTDYEKVFNDIYAGMSYGAEFNSTAGSLIDNMNAANQAIADKYKGIVLVFDEFGRYVEDFGETLKVKCVQDLAEYCDHSGYDNYVILVSHKQLSLYTGVMKRNVSDEWKKIEGRFKPTSINVKYDQCLSLIGHIIPKTYHWESFKNENKQQLKELYEQAWDFKGFMLPPDMEGENPFEDGFPLHPITLFALDRLSKKVAQNERTFFTYLAGDEDESLFTQLLKYDTREFHFIGLDAIYDYFEMNIKTFKTDDAYGVYKKLQYALSKAGLDDEGYRTKILKAIAVINIISDTENLSADKGTLLNVIDGSDEAIRNAVEELEKKKIIKYMRQYGYYDYFDSSIFDLESMIEEKIVGVNDEMVVSILNEHFTDFAIYPYRYNEKYHVNRVFVPLFAHKDDLTKKSFHNTLPKYYDGAVMFVLDDQADENEYTQIVDLPDRTLLVVNGKSKVVEEEVKRYIAIQYFFSKKEELAKDDPTVINELRLYLGEQEAIVADLIRRWRQLQNNGTFVIHNQKCLLILSEKELSDSASEIMDNTFNKTPIICNDLINKNNVTGAIKQARKKALECVINQENIYTDCGFLSPEFNVIRAVLSRTGVVPNETVDEANQVHSEDLTYFEDGSASGCEVMNAIAKKLAIAESGRLQLSELYKMLKMEPFGLRDGYMPILISYALREFQNVSLYFHGTEHSYTGEELVRALEQPENYTLFICNWNADEIEYIEALEDTFKKYLPNGDNRNRLEKLFKAMNTHFASVSKSARTTELYVSDIAKGYRDILSRSYKDYNAFFFDVLPKLNGNLQELTLQIKTIKHELETVRDKQYIRVLRVIRQVFDIGEADDIIRSLQELYKEEWASKSHKVFDYTTNNVLDLFSKADSFDEKKFVYGLAKITTGFDLDYWNDNKIDDLEETLRETINTLNSYNPDKGLQEGEVKITIESGDGDSVTSQFAQDELSQIGQTMFNKIKSTLNNFGASISYEEKIAIMAQLLKEIIN